MPAPSAKKKKSLILTLLDGDELDLLASSSNDFETLESDDEEDPDRDVVDENEAGEEDGDGEGDDEDDQDEDEELELEVHAIPSPPPTGRKRKRSRKDDEPLVPVVQNITYILSIFPSAEMKKPVSKRIAKGHTIQLGADQEWDTLRAQMLVKISASLNPKVLDFDNYSILFHIPRCVPKPGISLAKPEEYNVMIAQAIKTKNLMVYLSIMQQEKDDNKENEESGNDDDDDDVKLKKKGAKSKKTPPVYLANVQKTANIQALREEWACTKSESACSGTYCFVDPTTSEHVPLSHEAMDAWAMGMLNPSGAVTLRSPPNNKLFDVKSRARLSPVLQRRKEQQDAVAAGTASGPPVFNISLGNEFANLLRPATNTHAPAPLPPAIPSLSLLPTQRQPGIDTPIADFCRLYGLGDPILQKFLQHGYLQSRMLRFIQIPELKEMDFRLGEIAALKDAVEMWSVGG